MTEARHCTNCGATLSEEASCGCLVDVLRKDLIRTSVISLTVTLVVLATFWSLLNIFVPETWVWGWVQLPINIGFFLLIAASAAFTYQTLQKLLSDWIAFAICLAILVLSVVVLRSLELSILETVFKS